MSDVVVVRGGCDRGLGIFRRWFSFVEEEIVARLFLVEGEVTAAFSFSGGDIDRVPQSAPYGWKPAPTGADIGPPSRELVWCADWEVRRVTTAGPHDLPSLSAETPCRRITLSAALCCETHPCWMWSGVRQFTIGSLRMSMSCCGRAIDWAGPRDLCHKLWHICLARPGPP